MISAKLMTTFHVKQYRWWKVFKTIVKIPTALFFYCSNNSTMQLVASLLIQQTLPIIFTQN